MLRRIGKTGTVLLSLCAAVQPVGALEPPLPPGTTACAISGYAISRNRAGTPVRAEPDKAAKILGRLAPPQKAREPDFEFVPPSDEVWRTQFSIIGFRPGWMLIEKALHPYDNPDRRGALGRRSTGGVKTYAGRGWISLADVGGKLSFRRSMGLGALHADPSVDATRLPALNGRGYQIQGGNSPKAVLACSGDWVKVQSDDGVIGWWRGLCGEPIGDCGGD